MSARLRRAFDRPLARRPSSRALVGTLIGSAPGFLLPFAVARTVGIGGATDAYVFALAVAQAVATLASGVLETNVLPAAEKSRRLGGGHLVSFKRRMTRQAVVVVALVYVAIGFASWTYVAWGTSWTHAERNLAYTVLALLLAFVCLTAANSVAAAALYALDDFLTPTLSQACRSLVPFLILALGLPDWYTLACVAAALAIGELVRGAILRIRLRRLVPDGPVPPADSVETSEVWRWAAPSALSLLIVAAYPLVDRGVAASLPPGSVTVLDLGEKIFYVPMLVVTSSLVLVAGARWSAMRLSEPAQVAADFRRTVLRVVWVSIGITVASIVALRLGSSLVGPTFAGQPTRNIVWITAVLLVGLPVAAVATLGARLLTSLQRTRALPLFAIWALGANVVGDFIGAHFFGLRGIAGATVASRTVSALAYVAYGMVVARELAEASGGGHVLGRRLRPPRRPSPSVVVTGLAVGLVAVGLGAALVADARLVSVLALASVGIAVLFRLPRAWLPAIALVVFALVPTPYLPLPLWFARFLGPPVVVLAVWSCRTLGRPRRTKAMTSAAGLVVLGFLLWLLVSTSASSHLQRSLLWAIVAAAVVPLTLAAARSSDAATRRILLSVWTLLGVGLGAAGTLESVAHSNPLSRYYVFPEGTGLSQKWSVYRIETTLGHPLYNAMFFATTAALLGTLCVTSPRRLRVLGALLSTTALVGTVSRSGILALALGMLLGGAAVLLSRVSTAGKRIAIVASVVIGAVLLLQAPILRTRDASTEGQASTSYRIAVFHQSLDVMRRYDYLGSGPGTSQPAAVAVGDQLTVESSPLQIGISLGLPGVAFLAFLLFALLRGAWLRRRPYVLAGIAACVTAASGFNAWDSTPSSLALLGLLGVLALTPAAVGERGVEPAAAASCVPDSLVRNPRSRLLPPVDYPLPS